MSQREFLIECAKGVAFLVMLATILFAFYWLSAPRP